MFKQKIDNFRLQEKHSCNLSLIQKHFLILMTFIIRINVVVLINTVCFYGAEDRLIFYFSLEESV
jgi:hypothetical protein